MEDRELRREFRGREISRDSCDFAIESGDRAESSATFSTELPAFPRRVGRHRVSSRDRGKTAAPRVFHLIAPRNRVFLSPRS